jgi:hypothetical protein
MGRLRRTLLPVGQARAAAPSDPRPPEVDTGPAMGPSAREGASDDCVRRCVRPEGVTRCSHRYDASSAGDNRMNGGRHAPPTRVPGATRAADIAASRVGLLLPLMLMFSLALASHTLVGCGVRTSMRAGEVDDASSPTRGAALLWEERVPGESRFRRFELHPDGTLKVGGGLTAMQHKTDWTATPTPEDLRAILGAIDESGLAHGPPACSPLLVDGEESRFLLIEYVTPASAHVFELAGRCASLESLRATLERVAASRYQRTLEALPEAGKQPVYSTAP